MEDIGKKLKEMRESRGIKRADAARIAGMSYDYLRKIEFGLRAPNISRIGGLLKAMGATFEDVFSPTPALSPARLPGQIPGLIALGEGLPVPLIGWARAGQWDEASDAGFEPGAADKWLYSESGGGRVFALRVEGDSMEPEFSEGDFILVDPDRQAKSGDFVIAKLEDENEAVFKQLKYRGKHPVLHPLNAKYPDVVLSSDKSPRIVGVIVEKKTIFDEPDFRGEKLRAIIDRIGALEPGDLDRVMKALDLLFPNN